VLTVLEEVPAADRDGHCNTDYCGHGGKETNYEKL
jgi:hypothetical protein